MPSSPSIQYILGIDVGPGSIGWAIVDENQRFLDFGSRIFPVAFEKFETGKGDSPNAERRRARGLRRRTRRRSVRRHLLRQRLADAGLWPPAGSNEEAELLETDPWALRTRGLDESLTPYEIGRVFLHLANHRGFLSNRKTTGGDKEGDGEWTGAMSTLEARIRNAGLRTHGEFVHRERERVASAAPKSEGGSPVEHYRLRGTEGSRILRRFHYDEFALLWEAQAKHHEGLLTSKLRWGMVGPRERPERPVRPVPRNESPTLIEQFGIEGLLFFQRPVFWNTRTIGRCQFEPSQPRCPKAALPAQRFRRLCDVNHLRITVGHGAKRAERPLTPEERQAILDALDRIERQSCDHLRKALTAVDPALRDQDPVFNYERGGRKHLLGNVTEARLAKAVGTAWWDLSLTEREGIVDQLLSPDDDEEIVARLVGNSVLEERQARALLAVDLEPGYVGVSRQALTKLLPHLEAGCVYQSREEKGDSAIHRAGYSRADEAPAAKLRKLPPIAEIKTGPLSSILHPVVRRALSEMRRVVNALIDQYGLPAEIHVELARSLRMSGDARDRHAKETRKRENARKKAAKDLRENGIRPSRDGIDLWRLTEEQGHFCPYCVQINATGQAEGGMISLAQLKNGEVEIDHILPFSRTGDDSLANKVACHRRCNQDKGQRSPHDWLAASDRPRYEQICDFARAHLPAKAHKFRQKTLPDDFTARELKATGWIATSTLAYLKMLDVPRGRIIACKGRHTATLRHLWGLNEILRDDAVDIKNRDDHRHHAVDALVVALTNQARLQALARLHWQGCWNEKPAKGKVYRIRPGKGGIAEPWPGFRAAAEARAKEIIVSHRVRRKIRGAFHKESLYGPGMKPGQTVVKRVPLDEMTQGQMKGIRDATIRQLVHERLGSCGIDLNAKWDRATEKAAQAALVSPPLRMSSGVLVRKARTEIPAATQFVIRRDRAPAIVVPDRIHHVEFFPPSPGGNPYHESVYLLTALERLRNGEPAITHHPAPFLVLHKGDAIEIRREEKPEIWIFATIGTNGQTQFRRHFDARPIPEAKRGCSPGVPELWRLHEADRLRPVEIGFTGIVKNTILGSSHDQADPGVQPPGGSSLAKESAAPHPHL